MLALFVAIGLGYAFGQLSFKGFSLGVGAVLFVGLALGAIAPKAAPPGLVGTIGLVMFLYGIGIQYGKQFFAGLRGAGLKWNALGAIGVLFALAVSLVAYRSMGVSLSHSMGLFAGALTSTPTLQAAIDAAGNRDPAIGYSVAYPFGVIGPILCFFLFPRLVKTRVVPKAKPLQPLEVTLGADAPSTVAALLAALPAEVELVAVRRNGTNHLPDPELTLATGDGILLFGSPEVLECVQETLGAVGQGQITKDRGTMDLLRVFVSRAAIVGRSVGDIVFPDGVAAKIVEVRRGDAVILPNAGLVLEYGDRVAVVAAREALPALRQHFGDSLKSTSAFSYASVGLGMSLGVLLGQVQVPIPGVGAFSLGIAGGPLLVALVLGRLGRIGPFSWHIPLPANLTLREFGLMLFLAAVGLGSGAPFVDTVATTGLTYLGLGAVILLSTVLSILVLGHLLFKISSDDLFGVIAGATGNPAVLSYANMTLPSERVDVAYATTFPALTILKILCVQIAIGLLGSATPRVVQAGGGAGNEQSIPLNNTQVAQFHTTQITRNP